MAIPLGRQSPAASCNQPGRRPGEGWEIPVVPIRFCSRRGLPCRRRRRRRGALLPHPFTLALGKPKAVCFLWRFPWGRPRRTLSGAVSPWSPDFPPPVKGGGHPADWRSRHNSRRRRVKFFRRRPTERRRHLLSAAWQFCTCAARPGRSSFAAVFVCGPSPRGGAEEFPIHEEQPDVRLSRWRPALASPAAAIRPSSGRSMAR